MLLRLWNESSGQDGRARSREGGAVTSTELSSIPPLPSSSSLVLCPDPMPSIKTSTPPLSPLRLLLTAVTAPSTPLVRPARQDNIVCPTAGAQFSSLRRLPRRPAPRPQLDVGEDEDSRAQARREERRGRDGYSLLSLEGKEVMKLRGERPRASSPRRSARSIRAAARRLSPPSIVGQSCHRFLKDSLSSDERD